MTSFTHTYWFTQYQNKSYCVWNVLTYKTGLGGAKHSNWTILIIVPVTSASGWQAGWHVEIRADVTAYTDTNENLRAEGNTNVKIVRCKSTVWKGVNIACMLTFGVKALSDPVFPKHHIHPLPMATHKQSHLRQGGLTSWPWHLW